MVPQCFFVAGESSKIVKLRLIRNEYKLICHLIYVDIKIVYGERLYFCFLIGCFIPFLSGTYAYLKKQYGLEEKKYCEKMFRYTVYLAFFKDNLELFVFKSAK